MHLRYMEVLFTNLIRLNTDYNFHYCFHHVMPARYKFDVPCGCREERQRRSLLLPVSLRVDNVSSSSEI